MVQLPTWRITTPTLCLRIGFISCVLVAGLANLSSSQSLSGITLGTDNGIVVEGFEAADGNLYVPEKDIPLLTFMLGDSTLSAFHAVQIGQSDRTVKFSYDEQIEVSYRPEPDFEPGWKAELVFTNRSDDTLSISNVVPFGISSERVHITGKGDHYLSRTHLFRPGYIPVNVIVPDNAWELGYSAVSLRKSPRSVCALVRRSSYDEEKAQRRRFVTILAPSGSVTYDFYADFYSGNWQEGLRLMFQDRYLYDVERFDDSMFEREDLQWIRESYIIHLMMGWNQRYFYDRTNGKYKLEEFLKRGQRLYGGDDVVGVWPTWPVLGLDQRNQWDMYRALPGGLDKQRELAEMTRSYGTRYFISYNPWDQSTRMEDHLNGMASLIDSIEADGVVLDTRGSSSRDLQRAADSVRSGVVMYSEGMAVPKDMQGIVSGRVHNALYYPPLLNLNKFIKPDFAIFRVAELALERIRREYAVAFFNGYGTELNIFRPGIPSWVEEDYRFLGHTTRILRENSDNFLEEDYTPLIPTLFDSIYVNEWPGGEKTLYTMFSLVPEGFQGPLFPVEPKAGYHFVDLWNHREISPDTVGGKLYATVDLGSFNRKWLGTNNEGAVGAIARLPEVLNVGLDGDLLRYRFMRGDSVRIWAGRPDYEKRPVVLYDRTGSIRLMEKFGLFEGKFIIQVFQQGELLDERIVKVEAGTPRLVSRINKTDPVGSPPEGMVNIPAGSFTMKVTQGDQFISYPVEGYPRRIHLDRYYMDKHPVTNGEFKKFLAATGYRPNRSDNFLKHWKNGVMPGELEDHPVTYVSYEDAKAYAKWAGKRLPTEAEWQYAAQTAEELEWPWGNTEFNTQKERITGTLEVTRYEGIDSTLTNTGNGQLDPVGSYPKGENPHGLQDLVGSVWQMTNDLYKSGSYSYVILKGGSYYRPTSSWWYVEGGPRKLHYRQIWLLAGPGFERNATVGFRCVKDAAK